MTRMIGIAAQIRLCGIPFSSTSMKEVISIYSLRLFGKKLWEKDRIYSRIRRTNTTHYVNQKEGK